MSTEDADFLMDGCIHPSELVASFDAFSDTIFHVSGKCIYPISQLSVLFLLIELQKAILDFLLLTSSSGATYLT